MTHTELNRETGQEASILCFLLISVSWFWMLAGSGTGMNVLEMSSWRYPIYAQPSSMSSSWTAGYALTMVGMWWAMMLAMMLPAVVLQKAFTKPQWVMSRRFLMGYSLVWLGFSIGAAVLQYLAELSGFIDEMQMRSTSKVLTIALLSIAAAWQLPKLSINRRNDLTANALGPRSGFEYGISCVRMTAPMMLLMFVGGLMNLVWMLGLMIWVILQKIWPRSRVSAIYAIASCFALVALS